MSVLIKGLEMPQNCYSCVFGHNCPKYEELLWNEIDKERKADCPLVPVPPHGRLIDADALYKELVEDVGFGEAERFNDYWLGEQPTIIEAEVDNERFNKQTGGY